MSKHFRLIFCQIPQNVRKLSRNFNVQCMTNDDQSLQYQENAPILNLLRLPIKHVSAVTILFHPIKRQSSPNVQHIAPKKKKYQQM